MQEEVRTESVKKAANSQPAAARRSECREPFPSGGFHFPELLLPREHGAWGMISLPFIAGAIAGGGWWSLKTFAAAMATLSIFMLRTPLEALWRMEVRAQRRPPVGTRPGRPAPATVAKGDERQRAWFSVLLFGCLAIIAGGFLLGTLPPIPLLIMGGGAVILAMTTLSLVVRNHQRHPALQIASAVGLTASSLPAYLAAHGQLEREVFFIWALFAAHCSASVLVVHAQIESIVAGRKPEAVESGRPHRRNAWVAQLSLWLALASITIAGRFWLIVPFLPAGLLHTWNLWRLGSANPRRISLRRVGLTNLGASMAFCLLLVLLLKAGWIALP